jgi:hypothetical protein
MASEFVIVPHTTLEPHTTLNPLLVELSQV